MNKIALIFFIIFSVSLFPQEKYFIYFKDKGIENSTSLNKSSQFYSNAYQKLTTRSIERRIKVMGEAFITYEDIPVHQNYIDEIKKLDIEIIRELNWFNSISANLSKLQIEKVKLLPFIDKIEPVKKIYFRNEADYQTEGGLNLSNSKTYEYGPSFKQLELSDIPFVHSKKIEGKDVLIGVLDSGFDWQRHVSLKDRNVIAEFDYVFNDNVTANQAGDLPEQDSHGTYVFSILGGFDDSVMIGAAFNSSFILAKTEKIGSETSIEEDNYAAALIWMESLGVDITSSSLGYNIFDSGDSYTYSDMDGKTAVVTKAAELAFQRGVTTFTSAGNEGNNSWKYIIAPADGFNTIAVGAVNDSKNLASFSSIGPTSDGRIKPEIVANGVGIYGASAGTQTGYKISNGTSAATPIASGAAALLLSAHKHLKNTQIRSILLETSSNSASPNNQTGYGLISAKSAIEFPNIESNGSSFIIHKIIFNEKVNPSSVKFIRILADDLLEEYNMEKNGSYDFRLTLPQMIEGTVIKFQITFTDSMNNFYILPASGAFELKYGSDLIFYNLDDQNVTDDVEISDFFPSPFIPANHKSTRINFNSAGGEKFKIDIIDGSGQKVIGSNYTTIKGKNYFEWNGFSERGYLCASGVYYALIQLGDKDYGKKLVLLK